jgi:TetR/AcrR family transcriptional repressor of nem operon
MKKGEKTRLTILNKAFELIYANGYRATSIDDIIASTDVTKGAFYHHFKNKDEMGLAIIEEILKPKLTSQFLTLTQQRTNPLEAIYTLMNNLLMNDDFLKVKHGCPAANLVQEMTPWHSSFSNRLNQLTNQWLELIAGTIKSGQQGGHVNKEIDAESVAHFVMAGYWGARNFGKLTQSKSSYNTYLQQLKFHLSNLK